MKAYFLFISITVSFLCLGKSQAQSLPKDTYDVDVKELFVQLKNYEAAIDKANLGHRKKNGIGPVFFHNLKWPLFIGGGALIVYGSVTFLSDLEADDYNSILTNENYSFPLDSVAGAVLVIASSAMSNFTRSGQFKEQERDGLNEANEIYNKYFNTQKHLNNKK